MAREVKETDPLNQKEWLCLYEFLNSRCYKSAGMAAGYAERTAGANARRLLAKVNVKAQLESEEKQARERNRITIDRVIEEIASVATFDPRELFDKSGDPLPVNEISDRAAAAIAGMEVVMVPSAPDEAPGMVRKYRVADKMKALDQLMKHLGGYREDNSQRSESLAEALKRGRSRVDNDDDD